jgi:predicted anti-sigma-YlaC factor YlaD
MTAHEHETEGLTCREVVGLLADYLGSALGQELIGELEKHLAGCEPCRAYLNTYQRTKTLTAETERVAMPDEMKDRLRQFLLRALSGGR